MAERKKRAPYLYLRGVNDNGEAHLVSPQIAQAIVDLHKTGLFGASPVDVARELLERAVRRELRSGIIEAARRAQRRHRRRSRG